MKTRLIILYFLGFTTVLNSQKKDYNHHNHTIHLVELTNKANTPYSVFKPQQFLSQRALNRRLEQGIEIDLNDLPVDPSYIATIKSMGVQLHCVSKWLNAIAIYSKDTTLLKQIEGLPFVKRVIPLGKKRTIKKPIKRKTLDPFQDEFLRRARDAYAQNRPDREEEERFGRRHGDVVEQLDCCWC